MKLFFCLGLIILTMSAIAAEHNSILPKPQKVIYGKCKLAISGLTIGFASKPGAVSIFAKWKRTKQ